MFTPEESFVAQHERIKKTKGRRFNAMTHSDWTGICRHIGFDIITSTTTSDGLGRESFAWLNCLAVSHKK
ncbi:MAG: hypothetical protein R6V15_04330 [Desulfotignum sp.]